jgi:hypothetical protein
LGQILDQLQKLCDGRAPDGRDRIEVIRDFD